MEFWGKSKHTLGIIKWSTCGWCSFVSCAAFCASNFYTVHCGVLFYKFILRQSRLNFDVKNLKFSSSKPNYNKYESIKIKRKLKKKDVITAISSHEGEEEIILKAFCCAVLRFKFIGLKLNTLFSLILCSIIF